MHRQTDRQTQRQTKGQADRQTDRLTTTDQVGDGHVGGEVAADCDDAGAGVDVEVAGGSEVATDPILNVAL